VEGRNIQSGVQLCICRGCLHLDEWGQEERLRATMTHADEFEITRVQYKNGRIAPDGFSPRLLNVAAVNIKILGKDKKYHLLDNAVRFLQVLRLEIDIHDIPEWEMVAV